MSTGLEWKNEANNGLVKDIIPAIQRGYSELVIKPNKYKRFESPNGWGTVEGCRRFFKTILDEWDDFINEHPELIDVAEFWIE